MKPLTILLTILFISLLSSPSWSETKADLVERNGLYYKKFTDVPFTGEVTGEWNGNLKDGKPEGHWIEYYENGQLNFKGNFKDGKRDGLSELYYENGQLWLKRTEKDGKLEGLYEYYYENGQLSAKGNYKDGEKDGVWEYFNKDGSLKRTETY